MSIKNKPIKDINSVRIKMGGLVMSAISKKGTEKISSSATKLHEISAKTIDGKQLANLGEIINNKKAIMVVNVASK